MKTRKKANWGFIPPRGMSKREAFQRFQAENKTPLKRVRLYTWKSLATCTRKIDKLYLPSKDKARLVCPKNESRALLTFQDTQHALYADFIKIVPYKLDGR